MQIGVNLGGWLLIEKWMTPSLFTNLPAQDEFNLSQSLLGKKRILTHRQNFITEADFKWLAKNDIRQIRLPVGHWILKSDESYVASPEILDWAFAMADKYKQKILLDFHGLAGSQNGLDHSGQIGDSQWLNHKNRAKNLDKLTEFAEHYSRYESFLGLEIANEPVVDQTNYSQIIEFYRQAEQTIRPILKNEQIIVFSDGYKPNLISGNLPGGGWIDHHHYQLFDKASHRRPYFYQLHFTRAQKNKLSKIAKEQPLIIGEWSASLPNNQNNNPRKTKQYIQTQLDAFQSAKIAYFWSYKTEITVQASWRFRSLVEQGAFI